MYFLLNVYLYQYVWLCTKWYLCYFFAVFTSWIHCEPWVCTCDISLRKERIKAQWYSSLFPALCSPLATLDERRKRGWVRAEPSDPKRTKGYFICMVSIDRYSHPTTFIRRAGCHTSLGFPGRCQHLLHTIEQAPCGVQFRVSILLSANYYHHTLLAYQTTLPTCYIIATVCWCFTLVSSINALKSRELDQDKSTVTFVTYYIERP